jgi:hypothetical protein
MVAQIANHILNQLNQHPYGREIKKLLFLKLEMELNENRGVIEDKPSIPKDDSWAEIVKE